MYRTERTSMAIAVKELMGGTLGSVESEREYMIQEYDLERCEE